MTNWRIVLAALIIATGGCLAAVAVLWPGDQHVTTKAQLIAN
jgi:hypothetical protein